MFGKLLVYQTFVYILNLNNFNFYEMHIIQRVLDDMRPDERNMCGED